MLSIRGEGAKTQKDRTIQGFHETRDEEVAVESSGPYANHLHLTPDT